MREIKNFFIMLLGMVRFHIYVWKADLLHHNTGKRYYVLPNPNSKTKLLVMNSQQMKQLRKMGVIRKSVNWLYLMEHSLYYTAQGGKLNDTQMEKQIEKEKERDYIKHLQIVAQREDEKKKKRVAKEKKEV